MLISYDVLSCAIVSEHLGCFLFGTISNTAALKIMSLPLWIHEQKFFESWICSQSNQFQLWTFWKLPAWLLCFQLGLSHFISDLQWLLATHTFLIHVSHSRNCCLFLNVCKIISHHCLKPTSGFQWKKGTGWCVLEALPELAPTSGVILNHSLSVFTLLCSH